MDDHPTVSRVGGRARRRTPLLAGLVLAFAGCASGPGPDDPPDCSDTDCAEETAAFGKEVRGLEGVRGVDDLRFSFDERALSGSGPALYFTVRLSGRDEAACDAVEPLIGRLAWESEVSPLVGYSATCRVRGDQAGGGEVIGYDFGIESVREQVEAEWGPRPGG